MEHWSTDLQYIAANARNKNLVQAITNIFLDIICLPFLSAVGVKTGGKGPAVTVFYKMLLLVWFCIYMTMI